MNVDYAKFQKSLIVEQFQGNYLKHSKQMVVEDNSHSYYQRMVYLPSLHCSIRRILTHPFSFLDGQNLFDWQLKILMRSTGLIE